MVKGPEKFIDLFVDPKPSSLFRVCSKIKEDIMMIDWNVTRLVAHMTQAQVDGLKGLLHPLCDQVSQLRKYRESYLEEGSKEWTENLILARTLIDGVKSIELTIFGREQSGDFSEEKLFHLLPSKED